MLMGLVTGPVTQMVNLWNELQEVRIAIDRVGDVLNVKSEHVTVSGPDKIQTQVRQLEGEIKFAQVNFSYNTNDQKRSVMHGFDLTIQPGEHVAFVGPSGCGKSTIAKMVLGFYKPASGDLTIDGKDIRTMDLNSLRRNIGVVLQDTFIFGGTVAENIALGDPEPDMQAVLEAAKMAGSEDFIINFPLGYQTRIGEKGMGLSGGQRQRVGIARALYRRPKIMIFDEATSALDNESEARITQELKSVLVNRTSITIAHRLTTVMDSDRICFIRDGKVQEQGTHQQLTDREFLKENNYTGMYYQLARTQFDLPALDLG
jgi:subfamily B ATP-binding cassette protein HlyB/CyaB